MLGNDIVDYAIDEQKYKNFRFINRVLTVKEQDYLTQSSNPNAFLWSLWAAKEAAYKALQRNNLTLIFSPITFELAESSLQQLISHDFNRELWGLIHYENQTLELKFNWPKLTLVHCLACIKSNTNYWPQINSIIDTNDNLDTHLKQSQAVRTIAKILLLRHNINAEILRPPLTMDGYQKLGPPILIDCQTGKSLPHIISLSHDHNYLAVALYLDPLKSH